MSDNETKNLSNFKKLIPIVGLSILTISLMVYFRVSKNDVSGFIEKGTTGLADFYTDSLEPIFYSTHYSNEDVFNFALYRNLPVDAAENKYLKLGTNAEGKEYFEVFPASERRTTENYVKFVSGLNLNEREKQSLDSILTAYKDDIYASILVNDKKSVAVDPNLSEIRKSIVIDLINFMKKRKRFNADNFDVEIALLKNGGDIKKDGDGDVTDYIVFAPDTVFSTKAEFSKGKFQEYLASNESSSSDIEENGKEVRVVVHHEAGSAKDNMPGYNYSYQFDSTKGTAFLPRDLSSGVIVTDADTDNPVYIFDGDSLSDLLQMTIKTALAAAPNINIQGFEINLEGLEDVVNASIQMGLSNDYSEWAEFGLKIDSLANIFGVMLEDSLSKQKGNFEDFKEDMKDFGRQMKKLKQNKKK